jgi:hypothetical protein
MFLEISKTSLTNSSNRFIEQEPTLWNGLIFRIPLAPFRQRGASKNVGEGFLKQRFLNQKLGKRASRTSDLRKAKLMATPECRLTERALPGRNVAKGKPI